MLSPAIEAFKELSFRLYQFSINSNSQFICQIKIRQRRQNSVPEYAGERFVDKDYDYEYDPNLKLTTPQTGDSMDLKQGSEIKDEMNAEETMPMTDEERAYLEEHYRYIPQ